MYQESLCQKLQYKIIDGVNLTYASRHGKKLRLLNTSCLTWFHSNAKCPLSEARSCLFNFLRQQTCTLFHWKKGAALCIHCSQRLLLKKLDIGAQLQTSAASQTFIYILYTPTNISLFLTFFHWVFIRSYILYTPTNISPFPTVYFQEDIYYTHRPTFEKKLQ